MYYKVKIFLKITAAVLLLAGPMDVSAGYIFQNDSLEYAIGLFKGGEFVKATPVFKKLITETPDDAMLNYYYGACLAEQNIFTDETNKCLLKAIAGDTPEKIFYYVGKYFQSREMWNSALKYYNRFRNNGSEEEKTKTGIDELIRYCYDKANTAKPDSAASVTEAATGKEDTLATEALSADTLHEKENPVNTKTESVDQGQEPGSFEPINFQVNSDIEYLNPNQFRNARALAFFNDGQALVKRLDRVLTESDSLRNVYSNSPENRATVSDKILTLEEESLTLKSQETQAFDKARRLEQAYWDTAGTDEVNKFRQEVADLKAQLKSQHKDTIRMEEKSLTRINPLVLTKEDPLSVSQPVKKETNELIFRIQIGAYSHNLPAYIDRLYKKLSLIRDIDHYKDDRGVTVYTTGKLTNFEDALRMQAQVRQEGVKNAFVVAYLNGKRITLNEAKKITKGK